MSRAVIYEKFGGPEVLELQRFRAARRAGRDPRSRGGRRAEPDGPGFRSMPELAARFDITLPSGFGYDFAGVVDEVGDGASGSAVGERVYGGVMERAAADFVVVKRHPAPRPFSHAGGSQRRGRQHAVPLPVPPLRLHSLRSTCGQRTRF